MRAYQLPKGGAGIEGLVQVDRPNPRPAYRQVLVKVKACSLNFRDLAIARGSYRMPVRENIVPLSDGAGEVVEIGPGVTRVGVGDRVAGNFFQRWSGGAPAADAHKSALGGGIDGMLGEYAVIHGDHRLLFAAPEAYESVTRESVLAAAQQVFDPRRRTIGTLLPERAADTVSARAQSGCTVAEGRGRTSADAVAARHVPTGAE